MKVASINADDLSIFETVAEELDARYWFIECQGGFSASKDEAEGDSPWIEFDWEGVCVSVLDRGYFSKVVLGRLGLDEWTYLTGVCCTPEQLPALAKAYGALPSFLDEVHLALVAAWCGLIAVYPDEWWEIASSEEALVDRICEGRDFKALDLALCRMGENPPL